MARKPSNKKQQGKSKTSKSRANSKSSKGKSKGSKSAAKKTTTPKVNKGLNLYIRVRSVLWKEYKKDYPNKAYSTKGSEFLQIAAQVYRECRGRGKSCTDAVIIQTYKEIRSGEQRYEPFVGRDLYGQARPYWEIESNINWGQFEPYLWIISPDIIPAPHEFQVSDALDADGNTYKAYSKYFKQWVDYNNDSQEVNIREEGSEGEIPYFIFTKPKWNEQKKRWEVEIHIVTASSERTKSAEGWKGWKTDNFGFVPSGTIEEPTIPKTIKLPSDKKKKKKKKKKKAPIETETQKRLREEQIKETQARTSKEKVEAFRIKKKSLLEELKTYKELGMEKEASDILKRIQITNLQIDKALK